MIDKNSLWETSEQLLNQDVEVRIPLKGVSMWPVLYEGDTGIIKKVNPRDIKKGDIVAFGVKDQVILHRIVKITDDHFLAKGDNSRNTDGWLPKNEILGKLIATGNSSRNKISYSLFKNRICQVRAFLSFKINLFYWLYFILLTIQSVTLPSLGSKQRLRFALFRIFQLSIKFPIYLVEKIFRVIGLGLNALYEGLFLGLMSGPVSVIYIELNYARHKKYLTPEYIEQGLMDWEKDPVPKYIRQGSKVLLVGAGSGREILWLASQNCSIEPYDCNLPMIQFGNGILKKHGIDVEIRYSEPDHVPLSATTPYHVVWIGWGAYIHIRYSKVRINFLKEAGQNLEKDGLILLSFWADEGEKRYKSAICFIGNCFRFLTWRKVEHGDRFVGYFGHFFTKEQIAGELNKAGFSLIEYADKPYGYAVAKKR